MLKMVRSSVLRSRPTQEGAKPIVATITDKFPFLLKVFTTLLLQLGVSFYTMYMSRTTDELRAFARRYVLVISVVQITIILLLALMPLPILPKLMIFSLFSMMNGLLVPLYVPSLSAKDVIDSALQTTTLFVSMVIAGLIVVYSGVDVSFFELALFMMSVVLFVWGLYLLLFQSKESKTDGQAANSMTWYRNFTILLFSLYIIYDTYNILRVDYGGDFATAAFDYYLDVFNIFRNLIILDNED